MWQEAAALFELTCLTPETLFFPPVYVMSLEKHTQCSENLITVPQIAMMKTLETLNILLVIRVYYKIVCGLPQVALEVNNSPANTGAIRDRVQSLGWEDPGGGHGDPLEYSCLENPLDRAPWQAMVHKVGKSWT